MSCKNSNSSCCNSKPKFKLSPTLAISPTQYEAIRGNFFAASTPMLNAGTSQTIGIFNPINSGVEMAVSFSNISNNSSSPISATAYLASNLQPTGLPFVFGTSTNLNYPGYSKGMLVYATDTAGSGTKIGYRVIPPYFSGISLEDDTIIIPPGCNLIVIVQSLTASALDIVASAYWIEIPIC